LLLFVCFVTGLAHTGPPIEVPEDHATIQAAVDAAAPGNSISIGPGEYNENVVIALDGLRLFAREGLYTVIIDGTGLGVPGTGVDGILVMADGVELKDLVVRNFAEYVGPGVVDFRVGILVVDSEDCRLEGNLAHSNGDGIVLRGSSHCMVKRNVARNNIHNGIFLRNGSNDNQVQDNVAVDNGPDMNPAPDFVPAGVGCGIQLSFESSHNDLKGNSFSGNGRGLQLDRGSTGNSAKQNVSTNNSRFGIAALAVGGAPAASGNTIEQNLALANGEFDLIDQGFPPAVGNVWKNNAFETSNF
jgi:parallel beta-helix repeat protein